MFVVVVMLYVAVAVDNDDDKYMSTFRFLYAGACRGGNDTSLCLWTY
jgi:hypothetical protein